MALPHCILGKFLGVGCHCFPPPLGVPTFSARCLHVQRRERPLAAEGGTLRGWEIFRQISSRIRLPRNSRDLLHAASLRHETDGFTSPPKEGVLRIFSRGFEPANLGTKGQHTTSRPPKPIYLLTDPKSKPTGGTSSNLCINILSPWYWRELHNKELNDLYSLPNIVRVIKSRWMKWMGHVARMGESTGVYWVLMGKPQGKGPLGAPRRRW